MTNKNYDVKDVSLATKGRFKVEWGEQEMPVLRLERLSAIASQVCCR
jgi:S-adenosylhomocysteine hydrolase